MQLHHFYHVYADGHWADSVLDHIMALRQNGLYEKLSSFNIGFVGTPENIAEVQAFLKKINCRYNIVASESEGYEQVTLRQLEEFVKHNDGLVSYAHTKGSWHSGPEASIHRRQMEHHNFINWQIPVHALQNGAYIAGCWWSYWSDGEIASENPDNMARFFIGTYWWARCDILRQNHPIKDGLRHYAETWIGQLAYCVDLKKDKTVIDLCPTPEISLQELERIKSIPLNVLPHMDAEVSNKVETRKTSLPLRSPTKTMGWSSKRM